MDGTASSDVGVEIPEVAVKPEVSKKQNKTMQRITSARMLEAKRAEIDKVLYKKVLSPQYFLVLVLTLAVSIFHFVIFYFLTKINTRSAPAFGLLPQRPVSVGIFAIFSFLFLCVFILLLRWKAEARKWIDQNYSATKRPASQKRGKKCFMLRAWGLYQHYFDLDGSLYLVRLYAVEVVEMLINLNNQRFIFVCTVPVETSTAFASIFVFDAIMRAKILFKYVVDPTKNMTVEDRNNQLATGISVSVAFLIVPMAVVYLGYQVSLSIEECILITAVPSIALLPSLRRYGIETIRRRVDRLYTTVQADVARNSARHRASIFGSTKEEEVSKIQNRYFPYPVKCAVFAFTIIYGLFLTVSCLIQVAQVHESDIECSKIFSAENATGKTLWDGCVLRLPFCKEFFVPTCDCGKIEMVQHNLKHLDPEIKRFQQLRFLRVTQGPLRTVPVASMNTLAHINRFDISFNEVSSFDVDLSLWPTVSQLNLGYNKITSYNEKSLWTHNTIEFLRINNNVNMSFPKHVESSDGSKRPIGMKRLIVLSVANNSVVVPDTFNAENFPNLYAIFLSGNTIEGSKLPTSFKSFGNRLTKLGVAMCGLTETPSFLNTFKRLEYFDARNNSIAMTPAFPSALLENRRSTIYLEGNPLCTTDNKYCKKTCSVYCYSEEPHQGFGTDKTCDATCNSKICEFDGGDCQKYKVFRL
jgi:hypothetical protein